MTRDQLEQKVLDEMLEKHEDCLIAIEYYALMDAPRPKEGHWYEEFVKGVQMMNDIRKQLVDQFGLEEEPKKNSG